MCEAFDVQTSHDAYPGVKTVEVNITGYNSIFR